MNSKCKILLVNSLPLFLMSCGNSPGGPTAGSEPQQPNIILLVADDHGTDALGCYGNPVVRTPNLDRLAEEGVRFSNAYCTSAICSASRSAILTGMNNHAIGHYGHAHDYHHFRTFDTIRSLPSYLEEAGYYTARIGKYHLAPESVYSFNEVLECDPRSTIEMAEKCRDVLTRDEPHRGHPFRSNPWNRPNNFGNKPGGYPGENVTTYSPDEVIVPYFLPDTKETHYGKRPISSFLQRPEFELYDMVNDPHEIDNLSSSPEYSLILESMKRKIKEFQFSTRDPWMIVWDNESVIQGTGVNL